jgi:hypothetical protein
MHRVANFRKNHYFNVKEVLTLKKNFLRITSSFFIVPAAALAFSCITSVSASAFLPIYSASENVSNVLKDVATHATIHADSAASLILVQEKSSFFSVQNINGKPGKPTQINIKISPEATRSGSIPEHSFVVLRGLPKDFRLSSGFSTKNTWIVSLRDLGSLSFTSPPNFSGKFSLEITLHWGKKIIQTSTASVNLDPTFSDTATPHTWKTTIIPKTKTTEVIRPRLDKTRENFLIRRAQQLMKTGNVAAARMIFEDLALRRNAHAAYLMGRTYDPSVLKDIFVVGLQPDIEEARRWYRRAMELGSVRARERLEELGN